MKKYSIFVFILIFVFLIPQNEITAFKDSKNEALSVNIQEDDPFPNPIEEMQVFTGADPGQQSPEEDLESEQTRTLSGSFVAFDPSAGGDIYYHPSTSQTFCFRSETFTSDWEYAYTNWLKFPPDWFVSDVYIEGEPFCDNGGSWGEFSWEFQTASYEVKINHSRFHGMEDHCVATYCVDLTSAPSTDPAAVSWFFDGDGYGLEPHWPCSWDGYAPSGFTCDQTNNPPVYIEEAYLSLTPEVLHEGGCKGETQIHTINLHNHTGDSGVFDIYYSPFFEGEFNGPDSIYLDNDSSQILEVTITPTNTCLADTTITGVIEVFGNGFYDSVILKKSISSVVTEWEEIATAPINRMDNVLASYDGRVWDIIGYGSANDVMRYSPVADTWAIIPDSAPPFGDNFAHSGCQVGSKVYVYGDADNTDFTGLWSYNLATNVWMNETPSETLPGNAPAVDGIWAPAWVANEASGRCYMTGGATAPGPGNLNSVFVYDAIGNQWLQPLPNFTTVRDFHAAYLFNDPLDEHRQLCIAGGITAGNLELDSTQCYDFESGSWGVENEDLGVLPVPIWGMGYAQRSINSGDQLWLINGVDSSFLHGKNFFFDTTNDTWIVAGPLQSDQFYRTSAVNHNGEIYHVGGSTGGFSYSGLADKSYDRTCPTCEADIGEWVNIGLGNGCPDWYRYDAEYSEETGLAYLMGGRSDYITEGDIYAFNPQTGTCLDTHVDMLTPVGNYSIARLQFPDGERLCTFGGYATSITSTTNKVQCYSPSLNNIVYKANLPSAFDGFNPGGLEVVNNKAYIFGGHRTTIAPYVTGITYEYNPLTNAYELRGNMALARGYIVTAVADGMIYAFGGDVYDGSLLNSQNRAEKFNPLAGTWSDIDVPDLPVALDEGRAFGFDHNSGYSISGAIVIAGGGQWPDETAEALIYDLDSRTYDYGFWDLNVARRNHAAFLQPGETLKMWVIGGRSVSDSPPYGPAEYFELEPEWLLYVPFVMR